MNTLPYTDFDLPTKHLSELLPEQHYAPARTRDREEAERRRGLPTGTLLLEQQRRGLVMASAILDRVHTPEGVDFASHLIAIGGMNSSWYSFGRGAASMRRRMKLPVVAHDDNDWRQDRSGLIEASKQGLVEAAGYAEVLIAAKLNRAPRPRSNVVFGRAMGNTCLELGCIRFGDTFIGQSAFDAQATARTISLNIVEQARVLGTRMGTHPSIAQLADPDSDLSVAWRREAPDDAFEALEAAYEEVR